MLEDVRDVSAFVEALDESAGVTARAFVEIERGYCFDQSLVEPRDLFLRDSFKRSQSDVARDDWSEAPVVGSAECADACDLELGWVELVKRFCWQGR